jgi:predicted RNase H-like nuclease (RuvC/YqgF family)
MAKMLNLHILPLLEGIAKHSNTKANLKFSYALKKSSALLQKELKLVQELLPEQPKGYEDYQKDLEKIAKEVKDNKNIEPDYKQEEFNKLKEEYENTHPDLTEKVREYGVKLEEVNQMEYQGKLHKVDFDHLPETFSAADLDALFWLIEFPQDWQEVEDEKSENEKE